MQEHMAAQWFQSELDEAANNMITWSHWYGIDKDIFLKYPCNISGVQTRNIWMTW